MVDVGGRGYGPDAREVYEEGIFIPIMKLVKRGEVNTDLIHIVRNNVREADQVVGDIYSLAACNETGQKRLNDMLEEFDLDSLETLAAFILEHSERATRERISKLPHGSYENEMTVDGYDEPVTLKVRLDVTQAGILADFTGTSPVSKFGINVPLVYTKAYAFYGLKCALAPEIPNNAASLSAFDVKAPEGCILNALHPSPVAVRHVLGHFLPDLMLGALAKMKPGTVPAEGAGALWNIHVSVRPTTDHLAEAPDAKGAEVLIFNSGGTGARPTRDGLNATAFPSGVHTMPIEITEQTGPVVFWRKELRAGSGGTGAQRGGLGQVIELAPSDGYEIRFNAMFDRVGHPARGREGGSDGAPGAVRLDDGTELRPKGTQFVPAGQRLVLELPGGGGFGDASKRDAEAVEHDTEGDYVTVEINRR